MNELKVFNNNEFGDVRVVEVDNEPWFCLLDVCRILGITNHKDVKNRLSEKGVDTIDTLTKGGKQGLLYINESNLYKTIFQSKKAEAEKFTEWVTSEVIPSIRKHGAYMTDNTLEEALTSPDFLIRLATELKNEKEARKKAEDKPKVLFAEAVNASSTSILIGDLAKILKQNGYDTGQGITVKMINLGVVLNDMTNLQIEKNKYIKNLNSCRLLIIDDFGIQRDTTFALEHIFNVIDSRYRENKPVIFTTNLSVDTLVNTNDLREKRIYSRILEMANPLVFSGEDRRLKKMKEKAKYIKMILDESR